MLRDVRTIEQLKDEAITIMHNHCVVFWPQYNRQESSEFGYDICNEHAYSANNSVIAFMDDGIVYVVPYTSMVMKLLHEDSFREERFYVPFSNGDYPAYEKDRWFNLFKQAREIWKEEFMEDCLKHATVEPVPKEMLERSCLLVPDEGILTTHPIWGDSFERPIVSGTCCDSYTLEYLGKYCVNNGTLNFVNADGRQYITRNWDVYNKVRELGYREKSFFVIFSNGERAKDAEIAYRWHLINL